MKISVKRQNSMTNRYTHTYITLFKNFQLVKKKQKLTNLLSSSIYLSIFRFLILK